MLVTSRKCAQDNKLTLTEKFSESVNFSILTGLRLEKSGYKWKGRTFLLGGGGGFWGGRKINTGAVWELDGFDGG